MGLALFDFDGTITSCDTGALFHRKIFGWRRVGFSALSAAIRAVHCADRRQAMKVFFFSDFWRGVPRKTFAWLGEAFVEDVERCVRPGALRRLAWHRERGDHVAVVSASVREWLAPWCVLHGVDTLLATEMADVGGILTGRLAGKNCRGAEKVRRIRNCFGDSLPSPLFAYGDSDGDTEMLALAPELQRFFKPFRERDSSV